MVAGVMPRRKVRKMSKDLQAENARLQALLAEANSRLEKANARAAENCQVNGFITIPKGQKQDLVGKVVECTVKVRTTFGLSKSGNVSARITSKVPFANLTISEPASE